MDLAELKATISLIGTVLEQRLTSSCRRSLPYGCMV